MVCGNRDEVTAHTESSGHKKNQIRAGLGLYSWIMSLIFFSHAIAQHCMCGF